MLCPANRFFRSLIVVLFLFKLLLLQDSLVLAQQSDEELSEEELKDLALRTVVRIYDTSIYDGASITEARDFTSIGLGVLLQSKDPENALVITNCHVLAGPPQEDGSREVGKGDYAALLHQAGKTIPLSFESSQESFDIGVLRLNPPSDSDYKFASLKASIRAIESRKLYLSSNSNLEDFRLVHAENVGINQNYSFSDDDRKACSLDQLIPFEYNAIEGQGEFRAGMSGGPVFNEIGHVIGIHQGGTSQQGRGVPGRVIQDFLQSLDILPILTTPPTQPGNGEPSVTLPQTTGIEQPVFSDVEPDSQPELIF